jgi:hypothetical protein
MREPATLVLSNGEKIKGEIDREALAADDIVLHRAPNEAEPAAKLAAALREHLKTAERHPAGTTDRLLQADRNRPY